MLERGAVFDGAAGVEPFGFGAELDVGEVLADALQAEQRRVPDALEKRFPGQRRDLRFWGGGGQDGGPPHCFFVRM